MIIGVVIIAICIAAIYLATRSVKAVMRSVGLTTLSTGVLMILLGVFGFSIVMNAVTLPEGMTMPASFTTIMKGFFDYQTFTGEIMTVAGALIVVAWIFAFQDEEEAGPKGKEKK